ncbi:MAG: hypothetical protein QF926_14805 [Alphaproteobacteria bacterium]|jgi:hypothetical protein|nr:hypothetical protein [Alphaproteobacteria bacterium]MDP6517873.1 hypothetical protein [Alphaproteobacteria bacterium]
MKRAVLLALAASLAFTANAFAADDPTIKGLLRANIKAAMARHFAQSQVNGKYLMYDAVEDKLLRLELDYLHDGVVTKGDYYVSCVDMRDANGVVYDLDLLVVDTGEQFRVLQSVVHKIAGEKRPYHLED